MNSDAADVWRDERDETLLGVFRGYFVFVLRVCSLAAALAIAVLIIAPWSRMEAVWTPRRKGSASVWMSRRLCRILGVRIRCERAPDLSRPTLIAANHVTWADPLALGAQHDMCFLAKSEVASWPIFGSLARSQGGVFVDRHRRMRIPSVNAAIAERLASRRPVVLFAEATTSDGTRILRFHSSHFEAAADFLRQNPAADCVAIAPAAILYPARGGLPLGRRGRAAIAWYGDLEFLPSVRDLLLGSPVDCAIVFAEPFDFRRGDSRKAAARRAEDAVRALAVSRLTGR